MADQNESMLFDSDDDPDSVQDSVGTEETADVDEDLDSSEDASENEESEETQDKDDVTGKRMADTEKALKAKQAQFTKLSQQMAEMERALAEHKGALEVLTAQKQPETKTTDWLEDPEWREEFNESFQSDPASAIADVQKRMRLTVTDLVDKVNNIYVREISDLRNQIESRDPEREQLKEVIGELQSEEWFAALPPKLQLSAAKKHAQLKQGATRGTKPTTITRSPGGSGRRVVAPKPTGEGYSDEEKAYLASVGLLGKQESNDQSML